MERHEEDRGGLLLTETLTCSPNCDTAQITAVQNWKFSKGAVQKTLRGPWSVGAMEETDGDEWILKLQRHLLFLTL